MPLSLTAQTVYADGPSSNPAQPIKADIRRLLAGYEAVINAFTSNGGLIYDTLASMNADLLHGANSSAWVISDATVANNGVYRKIGASGTGSWTRMSDLPFSFISATDAGAGTPNAIIATSSIPLPAADAGALIAFSVFEANTASPVTVAFNGSAALTIKTNSGNNVAVGGLTAGMVVAGYKSGATFRLLSDQASAAIQAAAEAAATSAANSAAAAAASAASINLPAPAADTILVRNPGNTAYITKTAPQSRAFFKTPVFVDTRATMKGLDVSLDTIVHIYNEGTRKGPFVWTLGDFSAHVAADTREGVYVKASSTAATVGAWVLQTAYSLNPLWFKDTGDADDQAASAACMAMAVFLKRPIFWPPQRLTLTAQLSATVAGNGFAMSGAGARASELYWTSGAATRGIKVTLGTVTTGLRNTFQARDFALLSADGASALTYALDIKDVTAADRINPSVLINDLIIAGATNPTNDGWLRGINMDGCPNVVIDGVFIWGKVNGTEPNYTSAFGINYNNASGASPHPAGVSITNCTILYNKKAIHVDDMEGLIAHENQIGGCNVGIEAIGLSTYPHVGIHNNHINASQQCVVIDKMYEAIITGNLFYGQLSTGTCEGVKLKNSAAFFNITGNTFENYNTSQAMICINMDDAQDGIVDDNNFRAVDSSDLSQPGTAINLQGPTQRVQIGDGNVYFRCSNRVIDAGTALNNKVTVIDDGGRRIVRPRANLGTGFVGTDEAISILAADLAKADVATVQNVFDTGQDELTLATLTTYEFEAQYVITRAAGTTSHTFAVLFGGTATFTSIDYLAEVSNPTGNVLAAKQEIVGNAATALTLTAANTSATENIRVTLRGTMRVNAGGTIIPQFQNSAAAGGVPTVKRNSFFRAWPVGINTMVSQGPWS